MPYNPNLPQGGTPLDAVEMRAQFNGLKELIDTPSPEVAALTARVATLETQLAALQAQYAQDMSRLSNSLDYCTRNLPNYRSQQVGTLTITLRDPPTQADEQAIVDKLNQYITALSTEA